MGVQSPSEQSSCIDVEPSNTTKLCFRFRNHHPLAQASVDCCHEFDGAQRLQLNQASASMISQRTPLFVCWFSSPPETNPKFMQLNLASGTVIDFKHASVSVIDFNITVRLFDLRFAMQRTTFKVSVIYGMLPGDCKSGINSSRTKKR